MRKAHLAALAISVAAASPALAIDPVYDNPTDLIMGFVNTAGVSSNVEVNLGAPLQFKLGYLSSSNIYLGNINTQLTSLAGAAWYDNINAGTRSLLFGVAGVSDSDGTGANSINANNDYSSTVYATRARGTTNLTPGVANSAAWNIAPISVTTAAGNMVSQGNTFAGNQSAGLLTIANSAANDWSDFNSGNNGGPAYSSVFTATNGISTRLGAGQFNGDGNFGGLTDVEGVLDLYRISRYSDGGRTDGGTLTPGLGEFLGSFTIQKNGDVNFVVTPVPEPSTAFAAAIPLLGLLFRRKRNA